MSELMDSSQELTGTPQVSAEYVLLKRDMFWRPEGQGYTGVLAEAGAYSVGAGLDGIDGRPVLDRYNPDHPHETTYAMPELLEALKAAEKALADIGACDDPECDFCTTHTLTNIRAVIAKAEGAA